MTDSIMKIEDGNKIWRSLNGELHREDDPAVEHITGTLIWFVHGKRHRVGGPAYHDAIGGQAGWYQNDELHREDGPAIDYSNGDRQWWVHGARHRIDGPAVERPDGSKEWWLYGEEMDPVTHFIKAQEILQHG